MSFMLFAALLVYITFFYVCKLIRLHSALLCFACEETPSVFFQTSLRFLVDQVGQMLKSYYVSFSSPNFFLYIRPTMPKYSLKFPCLLNCKSILVNVKKSMEGSSVVLKGDKLVADVIANELAINGASNKKKNTRFAFACAMLASMTSILLGYDIGVLSGAAIFIKDDLKISDTQIEVLVGILNFCSLIGSFAAGRTSDWIGRRYTIVFAAVIFFVGAIVMGLAPNYACLIIGRFVAGIGVGYALMIAPVYTAEVAPASSRGFLTSFPEIFINAGILLGYVSNYVFARLPERYGWRFMLGVGAVPSVCLALGVLAMPESPRWLVMQGRIADAKIVLSKTSDTSEEAASRLTDIKSAASIPENCNDDIITVPEHNKQGEGVWKELLLHPTPPVRKILITAVGLHFFQQASGIDSVVLYTPRVFKKAGLTSKNTLLGATVAVGFMKTVFVLVATFLLDRSGRRPLLLTGTGGMVISSFGLGFGLKMVDHYQNVRLTWAIALCIVCILVFVSFFSFGLGPISWVYTSEVFPLRLRAQGAAVCAAVNRAMSGLVTMTFISLYKAITIWGSFFLYGGIALAGWIFIFTYLPETRGKTLEEMEEVFGVRCRESSNEREGARMQLSMQ